MILESVASPSPSQGQATSEQIPPHLDPRQVTGIGTKRRRLAELSPAQRALLVIERYPELRTLPGIDWHRLSVRVTYGLLFGQSAHHFANVGLALLAGILASAGFPAAYVSQLTFAVRRVLNLLQREFNIASPQAVTLEMWEAWGRDTDLMRMLADCIITYGTAVNLHLGDYVERLKRDDQPKIAMLLPPLPRQFRQRFVPLAERHSQSRRTRKAQTDVVSECAMAILALMLARYPSMDRFIRWYRSQIERVQAGELSIPARVVYEDTELDLPREPGPHAVNIDDLHWRRRWVRLDLTIWRPYEFSQWRNAQWMQQTVRGTKERTRAIGARSNIRRRATMTILSDPSAYFVELHPTDQMPWFAGSVCAWWGGFARTHRTRRVEASGASGENRAGVGTPEGWLASYLGAVIASQRRCERSFGRRFAEVGPCFDPEATYRGVLFGTAIVTLMLTADARIHELLQISADRFVKPARIYLVKNREGTPKRDAITNKLIVDVIVEQRLLPKGRKRDDLRMHYNVGAARVQLQEITRLLKATHGGQIPVVAYDRQHSKAEQLGAERYLFQWNGRHLTRGAITSLIRLVLYGVTLVDRSGERISITSHLLRHAAATVQRHQYGVPLDILAGAMGHTLAADGHAPEATRYYSQMTEAQKAEIRHETIMAMVDDAQDAVRIIDPETETERIERLTVEADERTREVLERYGGLHPVTFGHCGYPGLCVRGTARSFCLGCPFLVRRPEYIDRVDFLLDGYLTAADAHERMGDLAGARERKRLIAELRQLKSEMVLLAEAERDGTWKPRWKEPPVLSAAEA